MLHSREFDGRIALVTGASHGVGRVIATRLAADGATVVVNYFRSPVDARATVAEINAAGGTAVAMRASVTSEAQLSEMFAEIEKRYGRLDVLVNNAANGALVSGSDVTAEYLDRALDTNFKGSLACASRARPLMVAAGGGSVVNLSTLGGGHLVMANYLACGPAKAAVEALSRYLAVEYAPDNIRVNTAAAGMLVSRVADAFPRAQEMQAATIAATPLRRLGLPEELAEVVVFLASPRSSWVTGQIITADGGLSTGYALLSPPEITAAPAVHPMDSAVDSTGTQVPSAAVPVPVDPPSVAADVAPNVDLDPVSDDEIVVVGMGMAIAGANNPEDFWDLLAGESNQFVPVPPDRWDNATFHDHNRRAEDKTYSDRSAFITDFRPHPPLAGEVAMQAGEDLVGTESTSRWLRHSLRQALQGVTRRTDDRYAFLFGYTADGSQSLEEATVRASVSDRLLAIGAGLEPDASARVRFADSLAEALAERYPHGSGDPLSFFPHQVGLRAAAGVLPEDSDLLAVDTACSSSLYAIDLGMKGLHSGRYDVAVCGGAFGLGPRGSILFAKLNGLSASGEVRSLDATGDGVLFADGAAVVILKTLRRARADGDTILATLRSFGSSSDGKGKAIYAPSAAGQKVAITRALERTADPDLRPDWVVAHATGTPAGDLAEFTTLRESFAGDRPVLVTSNKAVVGHTGWAAGAVSLIEVILGMRHSMVPRQHRFTSPPTDFRIDETALQIPTSPVQWPRPAGRRRIAAVSGFGFGGTNAHLIVQDPPDPAAPALAPAVGRAPNDQRIAIVAMATRLPGEDPAETIARITDPDTSLVPPPAVSFGARYPLPSFQQVRMPPAMMRAIDRCQLMILQCAHDLRAQLGEFWDAHRSETGVVLGHMGATRSATQYASRCYLDDVRDALTGNRALATTRWLPEALDLLAAEVKSAVPPSSENTFPGMMPNVIPARVANYFDLTGLNMTVDTGFTSTLTAFDVAIRYLRSGDLAVVLAGGINGNATREVRQLLDSTLPDGTELAEGAFLFALTTERTAREAGLQVLGLVESGPSVPGRQAPQSELVCGPAAPGRHVSYLGAEAGDAVIRAVAAARGGTTSQITCDGGTGAPAAALRVVPADSEPVTTAAHREPLKVARHVPLRRPEAGVVVRSLLPFAPKGTVAVTGSAHLAEELATLPGVVLVVTSSVAAATQRDGAPVVVVSDPTPDDVRELLGRSLPHGPMHLRVVADLDGTDEIGALDAGLALHDLTFLTLQAAHDRLQHPDSSCIALLLGAAPAAPQPVSGLFTGLFKVAALELPGCLTFAVLSTARDLATGCAQVSAETGLQRGLPLVHYVNGDRHAIRVRQDPGETLDPASFPLTDRSTVVAVGGGRGITAELMVELARVAHPKIVVLGSNDLTAHPAGYLSMDDQAFGAARVDFIRAYLKDRPGSTPRDAGAAFQRVADARATSLNLARIAEHCGRDRVSYRLCDVTDPAAVATALADLTVSAEPIDLLVNAAGLNRSAPLARKDFGEFRRVRDLKVLGYRNLKRALAGRPPRLWCNFGSLLGFTGQIGEADYASANDFLAAASVHRGVGTSPTGPGGAEITIGWTLWGDVGLGANELTKSYFEKAGLYSGMSTAEGGHHFLRELAMARPEPLTVHLGAAERAAVERLIPGLLTGAPAASATQMTPAPAPSQSVLTARLPARPPAAPGHYARRPVRSGPGEATFERVFDLAQDPYLEHHRVRDVPTLPGTFVVEIAVEAATALVPDQQVVTVRDVRFHRFLKVWGPDGPAPHRIVASVADRRPDLDLTAVSVRVLSDVIARDGRVLVKDRLHFEATVLLSGTLQEAPLWQPWPAVDEIPVPDPYHATGSPVLLTGMFDSTTDTRLHPWGKRSSYRLQLDPADPVFSRFRVPSILLDGLARTGVLDLVDGDLIPLAAPLAIRRLDFYEQGNDLEIASRYSRVDLYATFSAAPDYAAGGAEPGSSGGRNRFTAVRPDGRLLLQFQDLEWTLLGFLRAGTGEFLTPEQRSQVLETTTGGHR